MVARSARVPTLSSKETVIIELLIREHELYGLQLVAASKRKLKRGTVYVTLGRMQDKGYITSRLEDSPPAPAACRAGCIRRPHSAAAS